jgi:hypothetical protein
MDGVDLFWEDLDLAPDVLILQAESWVGLVLLRSAGVAPPMACDAAKSGLLR